MILSRRGFLAGLGAALAAPAIIRTPGLLMPIRALAALPPVVRAGEALFVGDPVYFYLTEQHAWSIKVGDWRDRVFPSIGVAMNNAKPGDTIYVMTGHTEEAFV